MSAVGNQLASTAGFPSSSSSKREKSQIKRGACFAAGRHSGAPVVWGPGSRSPMGFPGKLSRGNES